MNTRWMPNLFPDRGRVLSAFCHHIQTAYGGPPILQSKGYCDWWNRKLKLTIHPHARQHLNMHKILPQHSYKCPWQPFLLHSLLYLQNNTANYETLEAARWERTLFKTFYFYNLRFLIWNLHKSLGEFVILIASGVHGSNRYILHKCRRVQMGCLENLETRMYKTTQREPGWNWTRRSLSTNAMKCSKQTQKVKRSLKVTWKIESEQNKLLLCYIAWHEHFAFRVTSTS